MIVSLTLPSRKTKKMKMNKRFNTTRREMNTVFSGGSCSTLIKWFFFVISFRSDAIYRVRSTLNLPLPWSSVIMEVNGGS